MQPETRKRLIVLAIVAAFTLPTLLAILLTSRWIDWHPPGTRNYGELLPLPAETGEDTREHLASLGIDWAAPPPRWTILARMPGSCAELCRNEIELLGRLHAAFGRRAGDVRILAFAAPADGERRDLPAVRVLEAAVPLELREHLPEAAEVVYAVADPEGRVILRYAAGSDPTGLRRDVNHLLTWSKRQ